MNRFQKLAAAALVSVLILIFVGAIVRVTGAGLGCPDWPKCWGCLIPPWKVEQVDISKIDLDKFQQKYKRMGGDVSMLTEEKILESFNPRHVWTEFINRLFSLPVGLFSVATMIAAFGRPRDQRIVWWTSLLSLLLVLINAWMGARVVYSGLSPGVLTTHMALAMLLICLLSFTVWRGRQNPASLPIRPGQSGKIRTAVVVLLLLVVAEGIMGTQIREMTDEMAKSHDGEPREQWISELEQSGLYLAHRSFSWAILVVTVLAYAWTRAVTGGRPGAAAKVVLAMVLVQMVLGVVMAQIHIYAAVQVLHVGLAAVLLSGVVFWLCQTVRIGSQNAHTVGH
ncbi:COX15/CtaA family protein [Haloferula rosea]|uniref:COX15/CtaA family protein n=1 Tax=Haloferula rosea TaxID=490093 RepID=A0A934VEA3_9BACT|nr:COX15/CtaA family protein [Haloferula rosea]MBK1825841.1 COX15/CtaA family protein [Haloferula rosea]